MKLPFQLGRYTLIELIGAGAFGRVYRAEVHGDMGFVSEFAVKVLDANVVASNPNVAAQMGDEARILAQLDHPNIVNVIDFLHEDHDVLGDVYYMVLEFIRGVDVGEILEQLLLDSRSVPATAALHMGLMVADALDHAHSLLARNGVRLDIVHRDLKPQNLMVNFRGQVKILDFGIAKARDDRMAARTQEGQTKGTIFYMSPEQLTGNNLDGRADLFSLGAILFELLMGRRLLDVEVSTPADLARAMHTAYEMDIEERLTALRAHLESGSNGELPDEAIEGWMALLRSALQKDPEQRPLSAGIMSEQLEWLRARHPQSDHRNFWARAASSGLERNSGPFQVVALEEVPKAEEEPNSFAEPVDFFGMDATTIASGEVPSAAAGRPEIPPPSVAVTRAMSVVEGTVRTFGSNSLQSITVPANIKPPQGPPSALANFDDDEETAAVAQTLNTEAHDPAAAKVDANPALGSAPAAKRRRLLGRDPTRVQTDIVRSLAKTGTKKRKGGPAKLLGLLAALAVGVLLLGLFLFSPDPPASGGAASHRDEAPAAPGSAAPSTGDKQLHSRQTQSPASSSDASEPQTPGTSKASPVEAADEGTESRAEAPRALDPSPQKTAAERALAEKRAAERVARRAEKDKLRRQRMEAERESKAREAEAKAAADSSVAAAPAATESGMLHLSARPRCKVSIDGTDYGTTDTTRRGVKLPAGTYKVRFVCNDEAECANFKKVSGIKTLKVTGGNETRYLADFYALNKKKRRR